MHKISSARPIINGAGEGNRTLMIIQFFGARALYGLRGRQTTAQHRNAQFVLGRFAAILLARIRSSPSTLRWRRPSAISAQCLISSPKVPNPSIRIALSNSSALRSPALGDVDRWRHVCRSDLPQSVGDFFARQDARGAAKKLVSLRPDLKHPHRPAQGRLLLRVSVAMSEYQYYEFAAIDGPISDEGLRYARGCSSRANVSRVRWQNTYTFGDFHWSVDTLL